MLRVCVSAAYNVLRKKTRRNYHEISLEAAGVSNTKSAKGPDFAGRERLRHAMAAVARLPRKQAQAVFLRAIEDQSFEEVAQSLGCSPATARSHFSKGKARLLKLMGRRE